MGTFSTEHRQKVVACYKGRVGSPGGSAGKESACNAGDLGLISGLGRSPGEQNSYPLQYSGPGEVHGQYSPLGCKELDTTERLSYIYMYVHK